VNEGFALYRAVFGGTQLEVWNRSIESLYLRLGMPGARAGLVSDIIARGEKFAATASSFTLGTVLTQKEIRKLLAPIGNCSAGNWIITELQLPIAVDLDEAWIRRQYARGRYPPLHSPHGWHQDGALGFNFHAMAGAPAPERALLKMVTCWIALESCGLQAPGLELITRRLPQVLSPPQLTDVSVHGSFTPEEYFRPEFEPGDVLLFAGDILHRTHVTSSMTRHRTSIELRFFPGNKLPVRLQRDRFVLLGWKSGESGAP